MLFAIGTKVKFLHTGEEGVVKARLDNGMVSIYLPSDDMEIPAAEEDLIRADAGMNSGKVKAKMVQGKKPEAVPKPPPVTVQTQYTILKSYGIQLAFLPVNNSEGLIGSYTIFLINDTSYDVVYNIKFLLNYRTQNWNGKLPATAFVELGQMLYDDLNEAPEYEVECTWITTEGPAEPVFKIVKIKPKSFFKTVRTAPFLNKPTHIYRLFERPEKKQGKSEEDLEAYTKRHAKPAWMRDADQNVLRKFSATELAEFDIEKDLHIDKLTDSWRRIPKNDILRIQLVEFDKYLEKAILMNVSRVFIIHGVGEGRLKDAIATRLMQNPDIVTFKNEFHPKYGWGATEVILREEE